MYDSDKHRLDVREALTNRGLGSYMNDTKWRKLIAEIARLPFPPPYQRKDVLQLVPEPETFDSDVSYLGDWTEGIHPLFSIEWIRIRPRYVRHAAQLLPKVVIDCQTDLEFALQSLRQPYEKSNGSIWIYGYR
ncbi:DUF6678 family protein [Comamonas sp. CMM02]|uniref:DUF6678 family protein n=1 Tax=Comamonas sp. CMM02 TaxID=2769307 RepID=UPI00351CA4C2